VMELQIQDSISFCCPVFLYTIPIYGAADIMITAAASTGASIFSHCLKNILYDSPAISHIPRLVDSGYSPHTKFIPHVNTDSRTVCPPAAPTADAEKRAKATAPNTGMVMPDTRSEERRVGRAGRRRRGKGEGRK